MISDKPQEGVFTERKNIPKIIRKNNYAYRDMVDNGYRVNAEMAREFGDDVTGVAYGSKNPYNVDTTKFFILEKTKLLPDGRFELIVTKSSRELI